MFGKCDFQLDRNERLLLSALQQGVRQYLSWFLSCHRKMLFLSGFILKPTERTDSSKNRCNGLLI